MSWLVALPLALWGLNDIPGAVAPYSPHRVVFARDLIGVGNLLPIVDSEGCGDATPSLKRVAAERELVQEKLEEIRKKQSDKFLTGHPPSDFIAGDRLWVQNRDEEREKLGRVWQRPAEIIDKISDSVYWVDHNGIEQDISVERLKVFVKLDDGRQPPLHYFAEHREIHDNSYVVERVDKHEWRGKGANGCKKRACQPSPGADQDVVSSEVSANPSGGCTGRQAEA